MKGVEMTKFGHLVDRKVLWKCPQCGIFLFSQLSHTMEECQLTVEIGETSSQHQTLETNDTFSRSASYSYSCE